MITTMGKDVKQTNDVLKTNLRSIKSSAYKLDRDNEKFLQRKPLMF